MKTGRETSNHLIKCSYCNALLPADAKFCSSCGERVEQQKFEELESNTKLGSVEVQEQETKTIRLAALPQIHLKRWLSYQSHKNNNDSTLSQGSSPLQQDAVEVSTQPTSSSQVMASNDITQVLESPMQCEPVLSSPTTSTPTILKAWKQIPVRSNFLWPTIIMLSVVAAGLVNFVFPGMALRPVIVFWFLFICPGMVLVRFLRLKEPVFEWTLAIALSFAIDALVASIQLYTGRWSPAGTLTLLMIFSLCGAFAQLASSTKPVSKMLHTVRSRKPAVPLPILLTLLVSVIVGASLWSYEVNYGSHSATSTSALQYKAIPHSSPTSTMVPTSSTSSAHVAALYNGTIYDISANVTTKMSLTGIQQTQITIGGNFTGLHWTGTFNGIIDPSKHLQFTVKDSAGHLMLSFEGDMQSDGVLSGNYCSVDQDARCTGEYGVWSVAPTS